MLSNVRFALTGSGLIAACLFAALLTWLCVGWLANQPPLTAMVAVLLVEVFLACFGVIAMLLTERMTVSMLKWEKRQPPLPRERPQVRTEPIWYRLPESVTGQAEPLSADPDHDRESEPHTIAFPTPDEQTASRRAA